MSNNPYRLRQAQASYDNNINTRREALDNIIKEILPTVPVTGDCRNLILHCADEFIHLVTSEATDLCHQENKRKYSTNHILDALDRLGFRDIKRDVEIALRDAKEKAMRQYELERSLENFGVPVEQHRQQRVAEQMQRHSLDSRSNCSTPSR